MIPGDQDVGEGFVVAQQHVVAGLQLLDEIGLEQERLGLGAGGDELHRGRLGDHASDAVRMRLAARIGRDAGADVARLAHIEHIAIRRDHAVDAGRIGRVLQLAPNDGRTGADRVFGGAFAFGPVAGLERGEHFLLVLFLARDRGEVFTAHGVDVGEGAAGPQGRPTLIVIAAVHGSLFIPIGQPENARVGVTFVLPALYS
jgi:hypothetical protein